MVRIERLECEPIVTAIRSIIGLRFATGSRVFCYNRCMTTLRVTKIGNSVGLILPKEALARLNVAAGDSVFLTESPDGYRLTPYDPEFEAQMTVARDVMKQDRAILHELAK